MLNANTAVISMSGKETNVLHMEKHACIRVEKPAILEQSVPRTRESKKKHSQKFKRKKVNQLDDNTESSYFSEVENICVFGPHCQCCGYVKI